MNTNFSNLKEYSSTFQFHLPWLPTVSNPLNALRDGKLYTNHTPISTESTRPDPSERSYSQLHALDNFEPVIDVNLLLDSLASQFEDSEGGTLNAPLLDVAAGTSSTEECVDLKPLLLLDSSDELFINNVGKTESICDPAERANNFVLNKVGRYNDPQMNNNAIYTPDNLSAAQSPITADTMEEEFFVERPYSAESSAQMPDFSFSNNDFVLDCNNVLNSAVCSNVHGHIKEEVIYDTPENSSSPGRFGAKKIFELPKMDLSKIQIFEEEIRTPDVINSIIEYEKIDLSKHNKPKQVTLIDFIAEETPSTSSSFIDPTLAYVGSPLSVVSSPASVQKPSKRRRYADDSDDEFVDDENDRDYVPYEEDGPKGAYFRSAKRGRPPKRAKSISSNDYVQLDPEEAKYREMRDRNNEASRRSRYKRKQKEMKVGDELTVEEERNVQLKAEVEELQKTVERFRESLMKVMLSKR